MDYKKLSSKLFLVVLIQLIFLDSILITLFAKKLLYPETQAAEKIVAHKVSKDKKASKSAESKELSANQDAHKEEQVNKEGQAVYKEESNERDKEEKHEDELKDLQEVSGKEKEEQQEVEKKTEVESENHEGNDVDIHDSKENKQEEHLTNSDKTDKQSKMVENDETENSGLDEEAIYKYMGVDRHTYFEKLVSGFFSMDKKPKEIKISEVGKPQKLNFIATSYDLSYESTGKTHQHPAYGITFSGKRVQKGRTIAVDPDVIPLGSNVYIEFPNPYKHLTGWYKAEDTGSKVKGNIIDVYLGESAFYEMENFGSRKVKIKIIDPDKSK